MCANLMFPDGLFTLSDIPDVLVGYLCLHFPYSVSELFIAKVTGGTHEVWPLPATNHKSKVGNVSGNQALLN